MNKDNDLVALSNAIVHEKEKKMAKWEKLCEEIKSHEEKVGKFDPELLKLWDVLREYDGLIRKATSPASVEYVTIERIKACRTKIDELW